MIELEFLGLPGSGKTTLADAVMPSFGEADVSRRRALGDDLSPVRRHLRRALYVFPPLLSHPRLMWGVLRRIRASRQRSAHALLKTCWNFWTVIGLVLSVRKNGGALVSDQGVVQAIWSVALSAHGEVGDWWDLLARYEVLPTLLVVVHCPPEMMAVRLRERSIGSSRLTGISAIDPAWQDASRIMARLIDEARTRCAVLEVHNDGSRSLEALTEEISGLLTKGS